ncbi:probable disease resistance protein At4g27220 [Eucalyptus grandis]|uniref:probable disease resistance protein At4g27220 n=1 Tax=Eucalyptus grandis TaxID=71139 RepID=UPI00192EE422|nr:probable disease resistance protein At4g27220 [Eucalyptus grandis]
MSIDSAISIAWDVLKWVVVPIKRQFRYVMSSNTYAQDLRKEVSKLEYDTERIHNVTEEARNNLRIVYSRVTEWLNSAAKALKEAEDLLGDFEKASKSCCYGTLPDPKYRYQFSRKAKDKKEDIQRLARECSEFKDLSSSNPAPGNIVAPTPARGEGKDVVQSTTTMDSTSSASMTIKLRDDGVFKSRASMIQDIMDALADDRCSVVGVHGMGGVGKSTLLADAKERIRETNSFHWVAKADVSQNPDIKGIQGEIADALGLSDIKDKESVSGRAELLQSRLDYEEKEKKKVLIILDNLWKGLDLKSVGIPCGHDNKVIGCKLLLTSRFRHVLRGEMCCDRDFFLDGLQEEEAKKLFERIVGDKVHVDEFKPLVAEALHKCAGLPFLIVNLAKRLKHAGLPEWKNALKQIRLSKNEGLGEMINNMLQLSYDHLKDAEKSLLALCVACGTSKPSLEYLVRYSVGWGLFQEDNMEEARDSLRSLIRTLQASSFLLEDGDDYGFKIHDLVHEFVASVASRDHPLLVLKDQDKSITELPKDKLKSCGSICFPYTDMKKLPQELDCPELQIFLLFTNNRSIEVPDSLFNSMRKLMVLNLTGIHLTCSPLPFQFLKNLHTLCLDNCSLDNVSILGELKRLQILSFVNSKIQRLPEEIGQLVELRLLDLNYCSNLQIIEPGVLRNLVKLEELYMKNSFDQWNVMEQTPPTNANMIELNDMKYLKTLHISILNPSVLPGDLEVEKLTKYKIEMGDVSWWVKEGSRILILKWDPISDILQKGCIQSIFGKTENLILDGLNRIEQSICALSQKDFLELKRLQVMNIPSIHYILQSPSHIYFKTLESLFLENLINLEKICTNNISSKSFSALKVVRVECCHKMEVLFPLSSMRELPQLKKIEIVHCMVMRGILEADESGKFELSNLHALKLHYLPKIKNFFTTRLAPSSSKLDDPVATQIAFFNGQQVAFQRLETLEIIGLDSLEFIFFSSMVKSLTQLKNLTISDCEKTEAIIMEEEGLGMETSEILAFPMLTNLHLEQLKSLTCFSHEKYIHLCNSNGDILFIQ